MHKASGALILEAANIGDHAAEGLKGSTSDFLAAGASLIRSDNKFKSISASEISRVVSADLSLKDGMLSLLDSFNSADDNNSVLVVGSLDWFKCVAINAAPKDFGIEFAGELVAASAATRLDNGISGGGSDETSHQIVLTHLDVSGQDFVNLGNVGKRLVLGTVALTSMALLELLWNINSQINSLFGVKQSRSASYHKRKEQGKIHWLVCYLRAPCLSADFTFQASVDA